MTPRRERALLWALLAGNFVIGTGVLMPAGMMNVLADAFALTVPQAGILVWAGAITMGIGAPLAAWAASPMDRRLLLIGALALYVAGHVASMLCTSFDQLLAARVVTVIGAAVFTPQAAAAVSALLPAHRRASGVTFAFLGWSIASAAGMPIGSWLGAQFGWQFAYGTEAAMALVAALALARVLPRGVYAPAVSTETWRQVARQRPVLLALLVTILANAGQFALSTYLAPEFRRKLDASATQVALMFGLFGVCGVLGNVVVSRLVARVDTGRAVATTIGLMAAGELVWAISGSSATLVAFGLVLWGLGCFASNSLQQARLIGLAPALAPASVALNSSSLYVGQAFGALVGASVLRADHPDWLAPMGALLLMAAIAVSTRVRSGTRRTPHSADGPARSG